MFFNLYKLGLGIIDEVEEVCIVVCEEGFGDLLFWLWFDVYYVFLICLVYVNIEGFDLILRVCKFRMFMIKKIWKSYIGFLFWNFFLSIVIVLYLYSKILKFFVY